MSERAKIATITLNPAIDQTVQIPGFAAGEVNRIAEQQSDAGGKGVNVASFLSHFGHKIAVTGFLGQDNTSIFETLFDAQGIDDQFVRVAGATRVTSMRRGSPWMPERRRVLRPGSGNSRPMA
jgi:fructose-1-phosphate kinase PfkB-like protein